MTYQMVTMLLLGCMGFGVFALILNIILSHGSMRAHEDFSARNVLCILPISFAVSFFAFVVGAGGDNFFPLWSQSAITDPSTHLFGMLWCITCVGFVVIAFIVVLIHAWHLMTSR